MIYHGTFISDENNRFNGKYEISVPMEQIFRGSKYFVTDRPAKKRRLSLSRKKKIDIGPRFSLTTELDVEEASKGVVPANTERANTWALKNYEAWARNRNSIDPNHTVPGDLLSSNDPEMACKWIQKFVMETRQESGEPYPPKSLYAILCGLYRVCKSNGVTFNFLDKKDARFAVLHKTLDSVFSSLHANGVGASTSSASVITITGYLGNLVTSLIRILSKHSFDVYSSVTTCCARFS